MGNDLFFSGALLAGFFVYLLLAPFLLLALAIPYAILRMRDAPNEFHDPQIGLKAALYFFMSAAVIVFLNGLTIIAVDVLTERKLPPAMIPTPVPAPVFPGQVQPGGMPNVARPAPPAKGSSWITPARRTGAALVVAGLVLAAAHLLLIKTTTNDARWPATRRQFTGWRFAIHGLVVMIAFIAMVVILFQEDFGDFETLKSLFGILLVWVPSWVVHYFLLRRYTRQPYLIREPVTEAEAGGA